MRGSSFTRGLFLTAQPQACAGLVLHVFFFFFNRAAAAVRGSSFTRCCCCFFFNRAAAGVRGLRFTFSLLTAQPQACAGLVLHVVFFFFLTAQP